MDLAARAAELEAENAQLRDLVVRLEARILELERQLAKNPQNSSLPPSADNQAQREARRKPAKREKGKRNKGKQPGAPGAHLERVAEPDRVVDHAPSACRGCGGDLSGAEITGIESRQVFDLPDRRAEVIDHRAEKRRCACGCETTATFPPEAIAPACWGPKVRAVAVYLLVRHHVPIARVAEILSDLLGAPVSTGWLAGLNRQAASDLVPFIDELKDRLADEPVAHVDETGCRVAGAKQWFHVFSTALLTLLGVHTRRGNIATEAMGVLSRFTGVVVHDRYAPYWRYTKARHAVCNAHILRDLAAIAEVDRYKPWANAMAALLVDAKRRCDRAREQGRSQLPRGQRQLVRDRYDTILADYFSPPTRRRRAAGPRAAMRATPPTLPSPCATAAPTCSASSPTSPCRSITTRASATCAWPSSSRRSAVHSGPTTALRTSPAYAATSRPPASTVSTPSTCSPSCSTVATGPSLWQ